VRRPHAASFGEFLFWHDGAGNQDSRRLLTVKSNSQRMCTLEAAGTRYKNQPTVPYRQHARHTWMHMQVAQGYVCVLKHMHRGRDFIQQCNASSHHH
jgi:hypothetical protein